MKISEITSLQNDLIKFSVKLQDSKFRKSQKLILVDGDKTIKGLLDDGFEFEYLFVKNSDELKSKKNIKNLVIVNEDILKKISTTKSPTKSVGIIKEPVVDKNLFKEMKKIVLLDGIKDAGNLGTIIRSAVAFSIEGIVLLNDCVDLYNSKTIRATAQNMFKIPIISTKDISFIKELKNDHKLIVTSLDSDTEFSSYKFEDSFVLAMGSEACGISKELEEISDVKLKMSMDNDVESLNIAVFSSIAFALIKIQK